MSFQFWKSSKVSFFYRPILIAIDRQEQEVIFIKLHWYEDNESTISIISELNKT